MHNIRYFSGRGSVNKMRMAHLNKANGNILKRELICFFAFHITFSFGIFVTVRYMEFRYS